MSYMKESEFDKIVKDTVNNCVETLVVKGKEYRRNNNPFHNFDKGVEITGLTREEVIWGFALKHYISIQDIKTDLKKGISPSLEIVDEKYGDLINYLLIEKVSIVNKITKK